MNITKHAAEKDFAMITGNFGKALTTLLSDLVAGTKTGKQMLDGFNTARGTDWYTGTKKLAEAVVPPVVTVPNPPLPEDPKPEPPTPTGDFPNATNTGVPIGVALAASGSLTVTTNGAVIEGKNITGVVEIKANNVTLRKCKITANGGNNVVRVFDGFTGFQMEDSEVNGNGATNGIAGQGAFRRLNIHHIENGINLWGPCDIQDCYIHDLSGGADAHFDGIECNGGGNHVIKHNTVNCNHGQTAALMLNNEFGGLANILVENNLLIGGGYTCYLDGRKGGGTVQDATIKFINNKLGKGAYGYWALYDDKPVLSGNVDAVTGKPV